MEAHIRRSELLTVLQFGFRRHHSTSAAVLKGTEDIQSNMEDGQVTVLVQNYSDGARMLVNSYLNW
jgi:hypothetical protein